MLNANELLQKGLEQVRAVGIIPGKINPNVILNSRAKFRFGLCRYKKNGPYLYEIELNPRLLEVDEVSAMNTVVHEILHSCEGCMNHGPRWKSYARIVNNKYGYNIKTCSSFDERGLERPKSKYVLKCKNPKCGHEYGKTRMTKSVRDCSGYRCHKCKTGLEVYIDGVLQKQPQTKAVASTATATRPQPKKRTAMVAKSTAKYIIKCTKCEKEYPRKRMSNAIKNINNYKCHCGGKLVVL